MTILANKFKKDSSFDSYFFPSETAWKILY